MSYLDVDGLRLTNLVDASGNLIQQEVLLDEVHSIPENLEIITTGQEHHDGMENKVSLPARVCIMRYQLYSSLQQEFATQLS